ncbi:MAG: helix-turn-helix domain-containing protein [Rhodospirillales bacterium]|nr:helix-turn-helix domain-containing protein [Rhodospirillales bacterium]
MFSADAITDMRLCRFDRVEMRNAISRYPALAHRLLDIALHEVIIAQEHMLLLGRKSVIARVASFLDDWYRRTMSHDDVQNGLRLPMTRVDLADYLGLTIETVSRQLYSLRIQGVITVTKNYNILVIKPRALAKISQDSV